jgi:nitrite reductase/ring-hydroxylating ferredoxin subunit
MTNQANSSCRGCDLDRSRREFLIEAASLAAGVLAGLGLTPRNAVAFPIALVRGEPARPGSEVSYPIPTGDGVMIDKEHQVILARHEGSIYAFALSCPHQNTALRWLDDARGYQCPKHKSRYQPDGTFINGRATRNMDRLPIRSDGTHVLVDVDRAYESDKDPAGWAAAVVKL